jgi:hypothetical protein
VNKSDLRVDWATHEAARYACEHWHYSGCLPGGSSMKIAAYEKDRFIGVVVFASGSSPQIPKSFSLKQTEFCELVRVALSGHRCQVSRIIGLALRVLSKKYPGLRLVASYADEGQGHHGGIYQASNWIYTGGNTTHAYIIKGKRLHPMTLAKAYGKGGQSVAWLQSNVDPHAKRIKTSKKHRYLMPLDADMRARVLPLAKPYPKRDKQAMAGDHPEQRRGSADRHAPSSSA